MSLKIYYRLSDKGLRTGKPSYINIKNCLENFLWHFDKSDITLIADNIEEDTYQYLLGIFNEEQIRRTCDGNATGFANTLLSSIEENDDEDIVYFVEDDYLHIADSEKALIEGLEIADYVTLYDSWDKYIDHGHNPYIKDGGEKTKVFVTKSCHWKLTNSTCMTFAGRVKTLKKDKNIMLRWCKKRDIPNDFKMWLAILRKQRRRKLISPIPGYATHGMTDFLTPLRDWAKEVPQLLSPTQNPP
tara:strand:+ start:408 stop:1139 length:732 start_codon:yes stop_codon:yes gene_type:complete